MRNPDEVHVPSVLDPGTDAAVLQFTSVSQVAKFELCQRKWWWDKVAHVDEPQGKAAADGVERHGRIEHYLKTGEDVLTPVERAGARFIPKPHPRLLVEHPIYQEGSPHNLTAAGVTFRGFIDLLNPTGAWLHDEGVLMSDPGVVEVVDWKFKYAVVRPPTPLVEIVQMAGYGEWGRRNYPDADGIRLSHGMISTSKRYALKVSQKVTADQVGERWDRVGALVARMKDVARASRVEDVAPSPEACDLWRGCFYRDRCPVARKSSEDWVADWLAVDEVDGEIGRTPPAETVKLELTEAMDMSLFDKYSKDAAAVTDPAVAAEKAKLLEEEKEAARRAAAERADAEKKTKDAAEYLHGLQVKEAEESARKAKAALDQLEAEKALAANGYYPPDVAAKFGLVDAPAKFTGVNPPDAVTSGPPTSADPVPPDVLPSLAPSVQDAAKLWDAAPLPENAQDVASAVALAAAQENAPKSKGRKRGAGKNAGVPTGEVEQDPPGVMPSSAVDALPAVQDDKGPPAPPPNYGFTVTDIKDKDAAIAAGTARAPYSSGAPAGIIDHVVTGTTPLKWVVYADVTLERLEVQDLEPWIAERCAKLAEKWAGGSDIRCAPEGSPLAFGKWPGVLADTVRKAPPPEGAYKLADVRESPIRQCVLEALRHLGAAVVRGVR